MEPLIDLYEISIMHLMEKDSLSEIDIDPPKKKRGSGSKIIEYNKISK